MLLQLSISSCVVPPSKSVSIPRAVGVVATVDILSSKVLSYGFNTASGRCCCNTADMINLLAERSASVNTASGRCCCNLS